MSKTPKVVPISVSDTVGEKPHIEPHAVVFSILRTFFGRDCPRGLLEEGSGAFSALPSMLSENWEQVAGPKAYFGCKYSREHARKTQPRLQNPARA